MTTEDGFHYSQVINKVIVQSGLFEMRPHLECLSLAFKKRMFCKNAKGTKQSYATKYVLILSFLSEILAGECLLNTRLEHSWSNCPLRIHHNFIFGMLY